MRNKRVNKFKKQRSRRIRNMVLYIGILPTFLIFAGYLISSLIILPTIGK